MVPRLTYEVRKRTSAGKLRRALFANQRDALLYADSLVRGMAASGSTGSVQIIWPNAEEPRSPDRGEG
jgi:hypothetical protein